MPFIRIFSLKEIENVSEEDFGNGNPAHCPVTRQVQSYSQVHQFVLEFRSSFILG